MNLKAIALLLVLASAGAAAAGESSLTTGPAFLWSPDNYGLPGDDSKEIVHYGTVSGRDLVESVLDQGGWSNIVCSGKDANIDVALVFIGSKLKSSDLSQTIQLDAVLVDMLKVSFMSSKFSMAFPYVVPSDDKDTFGSAIMSGLTEKCDHGVGAHHIACMGTCSDNGQEIENLPDSQSFKDFVVSKTGTTSQRAKVIFVRNGPVKKLDQSKSDGEMLSELLSVLKESGVKYTVLYASDANSSPLYPAHISVGRYLAESSNASTNSIKCDQVCQMKSSLLEGIFVGIVLLIILISGLCCMMGIDTPSRFEAAPES